MTVRSLLSNDLIRAFGSWCLLAVRLTHPAVPERSYQGCRSHGDGRDITAKQRQRTTDTKRLTSSQKESTSWGVGVGVADREPAGVSTNSESSTSPGGAIEAGEDSEVKSGSDSLPYSQILR